MTDSSTRRLPDEDAPTTIDRTVCLASDLGQTGDEQPAVGALGKRRAKDERWLRLLGTTLGLLLIGGSSGAFIRQRAVSTRLRQELAILEREYEANRAETRWTLDDRTVSPAKGRFSEVRELTRADLELHAFEALVDSDFAGALRFYQELSERAPEQPVYSDFVSVLRAKSTCAAVGNGEAVACR